MEQFFTDIYKRIFRLKPLFFFYVIVCGFVFRNYNDFRTWRHTTDPFASDSDQYYSYLPNLFIYNDLSANKANRYWMQDLPNGNKFQRFTCGVAVMESPFFFVGHWYAKTHGYKIDGYSAPYAWANYFGVFLYVMIALFFVYRTLRLYFGEWVSVFVITALFMATNLFFYTLGAGQMSHSFLFLLQAIFLYNVIQWHKRGKCYNALAFGLAAGLAILTRPSECFILFIPALFGLRNKETVLNRLRFFWDKKWHLLLAGICIAAMLLPQLLYWKSVSGSYIYYSYQKEGFYFKDPQIIRFLFGYRKGLIPYSPVMIFAFIGFVFLWKKCRDIFWAALIFSAVNIYFLSCWWDYGFGGGLGNRALVQSFTILAFPMASFFDWLTGIKKENKYVRIPVKISLMALLYFLITVNIRMTEQFSTTALHWGGMTKEAYWFIWGKDKFTAEDMQTRERLIREPDMQRMLNGERDQ